MDSEGVWIRHLQPRDRIRAPIPVIIEPLDRREEVRSAVLDPSITLECACEIAGRDSDAVERRRVAKPALETECPNKAVARHIGKFGGEVRLKVGPTVAVRMSGMRHEGSEQAAAEQLGGIERDVDLR